MANYVGLSERVLLIELGHEIGHLEEILEMPDNFIETLKMRIATRAVDKMQSLAPEMMAQSISNQMYWELVEIALKPTNLAEALSIYYPDAISFVSLALDNGHDSLPLWVTENPQKRRCLREYLSDIPNVQV